VVMFVLYTHWRFIFFVNLRVGIARLLLAYLHLPDYREANTKPLYSIWLVLFGSGVALLSNVLKIFGGHALVDRRGAYVIPEVLHCEGPC
jgi:hypothetical protein